MRVGTVELIIFLRLSAKNQFLSNDSKNTLN